MRVPSDASRTVYGVFPGSQTGIVFQYNGMSDPTTLRPAAQKMYDANVRFARITAYWYNLQKSSGVLDPGDVQALRYIVDTLQAVGITPYITLEGTACFAVSQPWIPGVTGPCSSDANTRPPDSEEHWQAWTTYVQQMTQAFNTVHYWGIWNEPNGGFLSAGAEGSRLAEYKKLVERAAPAIHAAGGVVIGPDLGDGPDSSGVPVLQPRPWLQNFLSTHGSYVDVVAVHLYGAAPSPDSVLSAMSGYSTDLAGGPWDLWLTEVNWPGTQTTSATDAQHAAAASNVFRGMNSGKVKRWTKSFFFNAGGFDGGANDWGTVSNLGMPSAQTLTAYDSIKAATSVTITGPSFVPPSQGSTFCANVFSPAMQQPLTYSWSARDGADIPFGGTGAAGGYTVNARPTSYTVYLTVTDAAGRIASAFRSVTVTTGATTTRQCTF